jgi:hypothetical protein
VACRRSVTACAASCNQIDHAAATADLHSDLWRRRRQPAFVLAQMIAQMKDRGGHIKIPGFYDDGGADDGGARGVSKLPFNEQ